MPDLRSTVRAAISAHQMLASDAPVVVAVSGGPDSLCLLHVLRALYPAAPRLHVAHLDHMIRGAESAAEAQFVADLARAWGVPATVAAKDVPALAARERLNLHAAARQARYRFLAEVARDTGAQAVAVAHHAGDQAETLLLHLLRGAGPEGLAGMRPLVAWEAWNPGGQGDLATSPHSAPASPSLIRPLLHVDRDTIERYCAEHRLDPRRDPSNHDWLATRNRIRHDLLPRLIEYNPHIVAALGRTAQICADDQAFLAAELDRAWPALARIRPDGVDIDGAAWRALHPALQRAALRRAHALLAPGETLTLDHVEQARALIGGAVGRRIALPGAALLVGYGGSFTLGAPAPLDGPQLPGASLGLPEHGAVALGAGWSIVVARGAASPQARDPWSLLLDAERLPGPLGARRRQPGDRLPIAAGMSRRVQDLLVDARIPQALRAAWPIVVAGDALVWLVGVRAAAPYLAGPASRQVVRVDVLRDAAPA